MFARPAAELDPRCLPMTELEIQIEAEANAKMSAGTLPALAYFSVGYRATLEGDYRKAITALQHAMVLEPENAVHPQALGIAYADAGDNAKAVECFRRCLELGCRGLQLEVPEDNPYFHLGWCLEDIGQLDEAEKIYADGVKCVPTHYESYQNLGGLLQSRLKFDQAIEVYQSGLTFCAGRDPKMLGRLILKDMQHNLERARRGLGYEEYRPSPEDKHLDNVLRREGHI